MGAAEEDPEPLGELGGNREPKWGQACAQPPPPQGNTPGPPLGACQGTQAPWGFLLAEKKIEAFLLGCCPWERHLRAAPGPVCRQREERPRVPWASEARGTRATEGPLLAGTLRWVTELPRAPGPGWEDRPHGQGRKEQACLYSQRPAARRNPNLLTHFPVARGPRVSN